jgi:hypothetical protein
LLLGFCAFGFGLNYYHNPQWCFINPGSQQLGVSVSLTVPLGFFIAGQIYGNQYFLIKLGSLGAKSASTR